jgi:hypothetical protein
MKKLTLLVTLIFTVLLSPPSFADWTKTIVNHHATFYVDLSTIKEVDGYVFYSELGDLYKPIGNGYLSVKSYNQGDCKLLRRKTLKHNYYKEPMAGGIGDLSEPTNPDWVSLSPNATSKKLLELACAYNK